MEGMSKGGNTRSGLLWQVERILLELNDSGRKPDVLIMENVPQVCGSENIGPFNDWLRSLEKLGYTNYYETINSKNHAIPQTRKRTFMISILGKWSYTFPDPVGLKNHLSDFLDEGVGKGYYLTDKQTKNLTLIDKRDGTGKSDRPIVVADLHATVFKSANKVYSIEGVCPTLLARDWYGPYKIMPEEGGGVRMLTEREYMRLMGFEKKDTESMKEAGLSKRVIYHSAGDSIATTCLIGLFGACLGKDTRRLILDYSDRLSKEERR